MSVRVHCPYCNAEQVWRALPDSGRGTCSRCETSFPVGEYDEIADGDAPVDPQFASTGSPTRRKKSVLFPLISTVIVATAALIVIEPWKQPEAPVPVAPERPQGTMPPAALAGIRWLPPKVNIVGAIQPATVLAYAERTGRDPQELLTEAGVPARFFTTFTDLGLSLNEIDHLVAGITLTEGLPGLTVVVKLRAPVRDESALLNALKARKQSTNGPEEYQVTLAGFPMTMRRPNTQTYLFGLLDRDFVGQEVGSTSDVLSTALREGLSTHLSPASFVWVATSDENWRDIPVVKALAQQTQDPQWKTRLQRMGQYRQAALGLSLEPEPQWRAAVRVRELAQTEKIEEGFRQAMDAEKTKIRRQEDWIDIDWNYDSQSTLGVLEKLLDAPPVDKK